VKYLRELLNRENVKIVTNIVSYEGKIGKLRQLVLQENGDIACEANFVMGLWDTNCRKLVLPSQKWATAMGLELVS